MLRLQRNRVGSYCGLEFDIAIGASTGIVVRVAELTELGLGRKSGLGREFDMSTGLGIGFDRGIGMLGLLW